MIGIKEINGIKHIISNDTELAYAYACYYTNHAECYINGIRYRVDYFHHTVQEDGYYYVHGVCFTNMQDGGKSYFDLKDLQDVRKNNTLVDFHWICFSHDSFISTEW